MTCLKMILDHYGVESRIGEINQSVWKAIDGSSFNTEIAQFAKLKGLLVDCFGYHLSIIDPQDSKLSAKDLTKKLEIEANNPLFNRDFVPLVNSLISAIKNGVNYHISKPSLETIKEYLEKSVPLIASVSYTALHNTQGDAFDGHDIVLSGIENGKIVYIDPEFATEELIDPEDLMFAIISRRAIATSAYLIAISQ
ncbi:hypothetical protein KKC08_02550 [Patescibacteria group bacterium]|nr:hypothetical protein [Patescibacteria group bacterium]MBU4265052.1 hypothetical protein [Patescibacteria group bacterium]MBU4390205.1 hypothetical protein [Patescibacteria group bacterium]MBU4397020.1 hypothetical protein [Patescibacteria group bacterium]MBU4431324.1 hypothetical protein [Patescibacteria group bacterium]